MRPWSSTSRPAADRAASSHLLAEVQQICDRVGVIAAPADPRGTVDQMRGGAVLLARGEPRDRAVRVLAGPPRDAGAYPATMTAPRLRGAAAGVEVRPSPGRCVRRVDVPRSPCASARLETLPYMT